MTKPIAQKVTTETSQSGALTTSNLPLVNAQSSQTTPQTKNTKSTAGGMSEQINSLVKDISGLQEQIKDLNDLKKEIASSALKAENIKAEFDKFEKRMDRTSNFIMVMTTAIAVVFVVTGIGIALDYFKNNEERYEKFIDKTEEIKKDYYSKEDVNTIFDEFKDCIRYNGLSRCLRH